MLPLVLLGDIEENDASSVGGKARGLARLVAAGLPVPPGAVLPVTAFRAILEGLGLWQRALELSRGGPPEAAASLAAAIAKARLSPPDHAALVRCAESLGSELAVRSSAVEEDGSQRSFAGQFRTELFVAPQDVPAAVCRCLASYYGSEVAAYRAAPPAPGGMAVLLQRMVRPAVAGVMFTINPLNGSWNEMVVEAIWGDGEALVSGRVAPHWFLVRRPRRLPKLLRHLLTRTRRMRVMRRDTPDIPGGPPGATTLDDAQLLRLCRLGLTVERRLGEPVDVEWCVDERGRFLLLQARPITAQGSPRPAGEVLWTRRFIGERWPEPATPMGWSIMAPLFEYFIAYPDTAERLLGGGAALRLVAGRPYVNATVFRHLAFKLPGAPPPGFMLELVPSEEEQAWRSRFAVLPDMEVYRSILATTLRERRWKRFSFNPFTNHLAWERFRGDLADALGRMRVRERPATLDDVREEIELIRAYIGVHLCSLLFAHLFYQLLDASLSVWLPQSAPALMDALARCPPGNLTLATNRALAELAEQLDDSDLAAMAAGTPLPEPAASELARFLARYGHRSEASWEIFSPRWGADPASLIALLRVARTSADPEDEGAVERAAGAAMAEVRGALGPVQHAFVGMLVHYTRRYLLLRENQRFWFDQLLWRTQRSLQDVGASLVEQGTLADAADVSMLTWSELVDAVKGGGPSMATRVAKRRATWQRQRSGPRPAVFFSGDTVEAPLVDAQKLSGLAISPGRARGRVRVLETLEAGAELEPGEVIVAHAVDPGWTPLFGLASAVVLEMGSVLSHGAVVAREYRLPAVVNIDRVTARLRTGDDVTVDGTRGVVWVHR